MKNFTPYLNLIGKIESAQRKIDDFMAVPNNLIEPNIVRMALEDGIQKCIQLKQEVVTWIPVEKSFKLLKLVIPDGFESDAGNLSIDSALKTVTYSLPKNFVNT